MIQLCKLDFYWKPKKKKGKQMAKVQKGNRGQGDPAGKGKASGKTPVKRGGGLPKGTTPGKGMKKK